MAPQVHEGNGVVAPPAQDPVRPRRWLGPRAWWHRFAVRHPFFAFFVVLLGSNATGSVFNVGYNSLVVARFMDPDDQKWAFETVAIPLYNLIAYPLCLGIMLAL